MKKRRQNKQTPTQAKRIAIIGGGIAGMFSAYVLSREGYDVTLFEASDRLGGRIRTLRLNETLDDVPVEQPETIDLPSAKSEQDPKQKATALEFYAEFGPMRLELDRQLILKALLDVLDIRQCDPLSTTETGPCLVDFPPFSSPPSVHDPKYELRPEEIGKSPLELLRLAFLRILTHLETPGGKSFEVKKTALIEEAVLATALSQSADVVFTRWMRTLTFRDYWEIQTVGRLGDTPLAAMGFWNLLTDHLSHDAVSKLRDLGTFYHLIAENPNAAEWLTWWLVGLGSSEPASSYWADLVPPGPQEDVCFGRFHTENVDAQSAERAESGSQPDSRQGAGLPARMAKRLINTAVHHINENDVPEIEPRDIEWYGIRDWGRPPYCGANHAWRPGRKYWLVMSRLGHIAVNGGRSIHVCGEAFSDYQGFIEGSLRSASYALHRILDGPSEQALTWLPEYFPFFKDRGPAQTYVEDLRSWVDELDGYKDMREDSIFLSD